MSSYKVAVFLVLVALSGTACTVPGGAPSAPAPMALITVETTPADASEACRVSVIINPPQRDIALDIQVVAEAGLVFVATGSTQSEVRHVEMFAQETRNLPFDCRLDMAQARWTGEYVVRAVATMADGSVRYADAWTTLPVALRADGMVHVLDARHLVDRAFTQKYVPGALDMAYAVAFDSAELPDRGVLFIRVSSPHDGFAPTLYFLVSGGVWFTNSAEYTPGVQWQDSKVVSVALDPIANGGARYLAVPFQMEPACVIGIYTLKVAEGDHGVDSAESAPIAFEVVSGQPRARHGFGLALNQRPAVMLTPSAIVEATRTSAQFAPPTSTPQAASEIPAPVHGSNTAPVEPTPGGVALPESLPSRSVESELVWSYRINGFGGTPWDLWLAYARPLSPISWEAFAEAVGRYNPHLVADGNVLFPDKTYLLPVLNALPAEEQAH